VLYTDASRGAERLRLPMLRQQEAASDGRPQLCLADFVAPLDSGVPDHIGAFAVTAGLGAAELAAAFERQNDDYHALMTKALADRLAEAFAAWLHAQVRREWSGEREGQVALEDALHERHRGIRPAFGYPACPDHTGTAPLFELVGARPIGMDLTESGAMLPAASVSGLYFAHPEARYFVVGRIGRDQLADYAARRGVPVEEAERWLGGSVAEPETGSR
jgi:5-methyltetrahydrofolate--homocysteine methyltransferase